MSIKTIFAFKIFFKIKSYVLILRDIFVIITIVNKFANIMRRLKMFDFAVIGAGVIGAFVARELTKYTKNVIILEKEGDVAMGATRANSAIVHAGYDAKEGSLKALLNVRGSKMMAGVCKDLGVKYKNNGSLVVGFNEEDKATLIALKERGEKNGVSGLEVLDREAALKIEPNLSDGVMYALNAPTGGIVCPYELCISAVGNAMDNGAELLLDFEVVAIEKNDDGFKVKSACGKEIEAKVVINCAGLYSDKIASMLGESDFSIRPRRGEYMLLDKEAGGVVSHTIFRCPTKMGKGILVTPTVDGNLLLGPTAEDINDKENTETTYDGLNTVKRLANEQVKGIDLSKVITSFTGLRSTGSTGDFIIEYKNGFVNVAGIESPGLSSAPAIGEYVAELIKENVNLTLRKDYISTRKASHWFSSLSEDEKNEVIKEHPEYAHIICRCELISEGEIIDAIRQNPRARDIDGIKRRTRASMGRCQGGFCTPYIVEILAKELGVDYTDITKFGKGSYLNIGKTKEV